MNIVPGYEPNLQRRGRMKKWVVVEGGRGRGGRWT